MRIARVLLVCCVLVFAVAGLKQLAALCADYLNWIPPFNWIGWAIVRSTWGVATNWPGSWMWTVVPPLGLPYWLLGPWGIAVILTFAFAAVLSRAAHVLRQELAEALRAARQELWRRELLGERQVQQAIHLHISAISAQPAPPSPWWTRPLGLIVIAVVGGALSTVADQWLNLVFGLAV